jgi:hypothetical protein
MCDRHTETIPCIIYALELIKKKYTPLIKTDVKTLSESLNYRIVSVNHQTMATSKNMFLHIGR